MPTIHKELPAAVCPITQEIMEDPVVCADGHSYERSAITQWLLVRDTSPCTNTPLAHRNVVPNYALRNLIAEVRGVRRCGRSRRAPLPLPARPPAHPSPSLRLPSPRPLPFIRSGR